MRLYTVRGIWRLSVDERVTPHWPYKEIMDSNPVGWLRYLPIPFDPFIRCVTLRLWLGSEYSIAIMGLFGKFKRAPNGLPAIKHDYVANRKLRATLLGVVNLPAALLRWIKYVQSLHGNHSRRLYAETSAFLLASFYEGCALLPDKAIPYGCAPTATRSRGVPACVSKNKTVLVDVRGTEDNVVGIGNSLLRHRALRMHLGNGDRSTIAK